MTPLQIYTDGACSGNPGPGGWAWAIEDGAYKSGYEPQSTNQRMEIMAAYDAVRSNAGRIEIVSDSTYVVHCFRDSWYVGWRKRGWLNSQKKPVANRDLWEPFIDLVLERGDVTFSWVKGHSEDRMNDVVDRLAVQAIVDKRGRQGVGMPGDLGDADLPPAKKKAATGPSLPDGHLVLVTGLRPPELGGYEPNLIWEMVRTKIVDALRYLAGEHDDLVVVTGMGLGTEQLAAEAAIEAGIPFIAAPPHPGLDEVWPPDSRARYRVLLDKAVETIAFENRAPATKQLAGAMAARRDAWLARSVDEAIVVHDGEDERTEKVVASLVLQLGDDNVLQLHP